MLNRDALGQLSQLKNEIRQSKAYSEGVVRGTNGKFGFVVLDDGSESFLPPAEMERVFPGDRVRVSIEDKGEGKSEAELDALLEQGVTRLVGQYIQRGQGHFVQPHIPGFNRWIFLPPKSRGKASPGDYIACTISRHPFKDGRGQAKVTEVIGNPDQAGIEHHYTIAQFELPAAFPEALEKEAAQLAEKLPEVVATRRDASDLGFVTIDAETTRDMDDALAIEKTDNGWLLHVAIADPASLIEPESTLDNEARKRATSVYLPGQTLNMMPAVLGENAFSLIPGEARPVVIASIEITSDGSIHNCKFEEAAITSGAKLSYKAVAELLENGGSEQVDASLHERLRELQACANARLEYRSEHTALMEERPEYRLILDDKLHIERIALRQRNAAHRLVEEAMLAANICIGEKLAECQAGIFSEHLGFRDERMEEVRAILREQAPEFADRDLHQLDNYVELIRHLDGNPEKHAVLAVLKRMLRPGAFAPAAGPHLGLGLAQYATATSPIRKYNDLHNHRILKAALGGNEMPAIEPQQVEDLQAQVVLGRRADRLLEQWLHCIFLTDKIGAEYAGTVVRVTGSGIGVRLNDNGIEGFIRIRTGKKTDATFDGKYLTLTKGEQRYQLDQQVTVKIDSVDLGRRNIQLALVQPAEASETEAPETEQATKPTEGSNDNE
ncbi:VacB/RNase II family 3'-5' exoribonuclease [Biformimicrobium ophioploci]|uniref:exoribonuclease II n=1 Tax=Biformimicrobium ophioploci TaxID=3036711 RepID=A0ABQ6M2D2_9GAMM|nr:VacB/RNase II family 3'-5' exoribonuclease [Microbulbifer sp. NKW57]GMG88514.1 exoribonuclease II [Microbulbifer sp. NKW57]